LNRAEFHAREAVRLRPEHTAILNNLVSVLMHFEDETHKTEAKLRFEEAIRQVPPDFEWSQEYLEEVAQKLEIEIDQMYLTNEQNKGERFE
jgi:hypothetical protein